MNGFLLRIFSAFILNTVNLGYYQLFYKISKKSVANYVSIVEIKTRSQKMQYQSKTMQINLE